MTARPRSGAPGPAWSSVERGLAARARAGIAVTLAALLLYAAADLVAHRAIVVPLWSIAAAQIVTLGIAASLLRGTPSRRRTTATVLGTMAVVQWSGVASDALSANAMATVFSGLGATVGTAALFPWGGAAQAMMAGITAVTMALSIACVQAPAGSLAYPAAIGATLLGGSVLVAAAAERLRRERTVAEEVLTAFAHRAETEARVATVLARASEVLAAHLDEPDMLDRLHAIARESLGVDWSSTFVLEAPGGGFRLVANDGAPPALREEMLQAELPAAWMPAADPDGAFEVPDTAAAGGVRPDVLAHMRSASFVGAPMLCRGRLLGVQLHGYGTRTGGFPPEARRLAVGLAHASALALENARRIAGLEAASRLKTEFVATMSHELRTPLNVITGYTEMLGDDALGPLTAMQRDTVQRIRRSADELLELVNATLDVGRLEAGRVAIERRPVDLPTLIAELDAELRPVLVPGVALRWRDAGAPGTVLTDRAKLKTVLKNVVGNACKFTACGGIEVSTGWDDGTLELVVLDTGVGIPPEQLPHIFDMFRQGDGSATRRFHGVGLGLHIVRRLIDLLGGTIGVQSAPGTGSRFTLRVPAAAVSSTLPEPIRASA